MSAGYTPGSHASVFRRCSGAMPTIFISESGRPNSRTRYYKGVANND